nr:unnamed protein product [Callosobruchus analis]
MAAKQDDWRCYCSIVNLPSSTDIIERVMCSKLKFCLAAVCLATAVVSVTEAKKDEMDTLKLIHVFFRHGARTPELKHVFPTDPYGADAFAPMGYGQLTNLGKWQAFRLGERLRDRYDRFLRKVYHPEDVYALSTDFDRTKASLLLVLAGLYPPVDTQRWHESLNWQPIATHYKEDHLDYFLRRPNKYCPAYMAELDQALKSDKHQEYLKSMMSTLEYLTEHTGIQVKTTSAAFGVYQTIRAEQVMNLTLPKWTENGIYPEALTQLAIRQCLVENSTPRLRRLNGGRSLQKVIDNMIAKIECRLRPTNRKIFLYSGHENNVVNLLTALGFFDSSEEQHFPNYSSAVVIELHRGKEDHAVQILYLRDVEAEYEAIEIKGCEGTEDNLCPLKDFIRLTKDVVPVNYTDECQSLVNLD